MHTYVSSNTWKKSSFLPDFFSSPSPQAIMRDAVSCGRSAVLWQSFPPRHGLPAYRWPSHVVDRVLPSPIRKRTTDSSNCYGAHFCNGCSFIHQEHCDVRLFAGRNEEGHFMTSLVCGDIAAVMCSADQWTAFALPELVQPDLLLTPGV